MDEWTRQEIRRQQVARDLHLLADAERRRRMSQARHPTLYVNDTAIDLRPFILLIRLLLWPLYAVPRWLFRKLSPRTQRKVQRAVVMTLAAIGILAAAFVVLAIVVGSIHGAHQGG